MALSLLAKNIRRFYELNSARKALEKEEAALKVFFKHEAGMAEVNFEDKAKGLVVSVTNESATRVDLDLMRLELGEKIKKWEVQTTHQKVTVRATVKVAA